MKLVLLLIAVAIASASAQKQCTLKKIKYSPIAPSFTLGEDKVNDVRIERRPPLTY